MNKAILLLISIVSGAVFAQQPSGVPFVNGFADTKTHHSHQVTWSDIDQQSGKMQLTAGPNFVGSSLAYFRRGNGQLLYGFNMDILSVGTGNDLLSEYYNAGFPGLSETNLLLPFWLSLKVRLTNRPASKVAPYVIAGLGPALSLRMNNSVGFFDALTSINADLGGGAYMGLGVDYMWADSWAISADVRYIAIDFDTPLRFSEEYDGVSLAIGFMRAF